MYWRLLVLALSFLLLLMGGHEHPTPLKSFSIVTILNAVFLPDSSHLNVVIAVPYAINDMLDQADSARSWYIDQRRLRFIFTY